MAKTREEKKKVEKLKLKDLKKRHWTVIAAVGVSFGLLIGNMGGAEETPKADAKVEAKEDYSMKHYAPDRVVKDGIAIAPWESNKFDKYPVQFWVKNTSTEAVKLVVRVDDPALGTAIESHEVELKAGQDTVVAFHNVKNAGTYQAVVIGDGLHMKTKEITVK